jgi:hypothetical protein
MYSGTHYWNCMVCKRLNVLFFFFLSDFYLLKNNFASLILQRTKKYVLHEVFPCFFVSCKTNARIKLSKTGHGPHSSKLVVICVLLLLFVPFCVLFVCKCVLPPGDKPIAVNKYIIKHVYVINTYVVVGQMKIAMECKNAFWIKHVCTVHNKQPSTVMVLECVSELIVNMTVTKACELVAEKKSVVLLKKPSFGHVSGTCTRSFVMEKQGCARQ